MIRSISYSLLMDWLKCGEAMRLKHIEGFWPPPTPSSHAGRAFHKTLELDNKSKIEGEGPLPLSALKHTFSLEYQMNLEIKGVLLSKQEKTIKDKILNQFLHRGLKGLEVYFDHAKTIMPLEIEQAYVVDIGYPLPLKGIVDLTIIGDTIVDYKLSKAKNQTWADKNLQGNIYSYLYYNKHGRIPTILYYIYSERKENPIIELKTKHTNASFKALMCYIEAFWQDLEQNVFRPTNPTEWVCSDKWCAFYDFCKFSTRGGEEIYGERI